MKKTRLLGAICAILFIFSTFSAEAALQMYFGGNDLSIQKANLDGTGIETVIPFFGLQGTPTLAANTAGGKMYISDINTISRANYDGTDFEILIPPYNNFQGIAVDPINNKIYFSDPSLGKIQRTNLDGSGIEDIIDSTVSPLFNPFGLALDLTGGKIYIASTSRISRANLDGTGYEELVIGTNFAADVALDTAAGKMYWTELFNNSIKRANLDGTAVETIVSGIQQPRSPFLDFSEGKMYYTDALAGTIHRANFDGTNVELLISGVNHPSTVALYTNTSSLVEDLTQLTSDATDIVAAAIVPGGNGLVAKLIGDDGIVQKVNNAVNAYESGLILISDYLSQLDEALNMLNAFDNQLANKIRSGMIVDPEASQLLDISVEIRQTINNLIENA